MSNSDQLKWGTFKESLLLHPDLHLQFKYTEDKWVDASYHITEIKQAPVTSVDCGGVLNRWTEIIVQLWIPENQQENSAMTVSKALSIVSVVENMLPLDPEGIVKIEFGNSVFDTRQMFPKLPMVSGENLIVDLQPDAVQCKAIGRGESCGTTDKPKVQLKNLAAGGSCTPASGCCQ
jgi:hypothetical protein